MVKNPLSLLFMIGVCKPIYFISLNLRHHQDCLRNIRNISTLSLSDNICPCYKQLNVKGIHSFLTKKILSDQDPKPVGDNNPDIELGERRSNLWQSANSLYWSVYFVSMSDWFASFDRQLDHHFLLSVCTIHDFNDAGQGVTSCLSPGHISIYKCLKHDLAGRWQRDYPYKYFLLSLWVSDWDSGLFQVPSHGYTVIIHSGPGNEGISQNKMGRTLNAAWPIAETPSWDLSLSDSNKQIYIYTVPWLYFVEQNE